MSQVTMYLDEVTEKRMDKAARESELSRSRSVAGLIRKRIRSEWPESFKKAIGGRGDDFPEFEEIREAVGEDGVAERLLATPGDEIAVPAVVLYELEVGVRKSKRPNTKERGRIEGPRLEDGSRGARSDPA